MEFPTKRCFHQPESRFFYQQTVITVLEQTSVPYPCGVFLKCEIFHDIHVD